MASQLLLALKQSPISTDDYIDLKSAAGGYQITKFKQGDAYFNEWGWPVRDLNFTLMITATNGLIGAAAALDLMKKWNRLENFIQTTNNYFKMLNGTIPSSLNETWHEGKAFTLTELLDNAPGPTYWDGWGGKISLPENYDNFANWGGYKFTEVTMVLQVSMLARDNFVLLENLVPDGNFMPPFNPVNTNYQNTHTFSNPNSHEIRETGGRYGPFVLWQLTNQDIVDDFSTGSARALTTSNTIAVTTPSSRVWRLKTTSGTPTFNTNSAGKGVFSTNGNGFFVYTEYGHGGRQNGDAGFTLGVGQGAQNGITEATVLSDWYFDPAVGQANVNYLRPGLFMRGDDSISDPHEPIVLYAGQYLTLGRFYVSSGGLLQIYQTGTVALVNGTKYLLRMTATDNSILCQIYNAGTMALVDSFTYTDAAWFNPHNNTNKGKVGIFQMSAGNTTGKSASFYAYTTKALATSTYMDAMGGGSYYAEQQNDFFVPSIWVNVAYIDIGAVTVQLRSLNAPGTVLRTLTPTGKTYGTSWVQYSAAGYPARAGGESTLDGYYLRLLGPAQGYIGYDGLAIWRNPVGDALPVEYAVTGTKVNQPGGGVYDVQGTGEAPVQVHFIGSATRIGANLSTIQQVFLIGGHRYNSSYDSPLFGMDLKLYNYNYNSGLVLADTALAGVMWEVAGTVITSTGAATNAFYPIPFDTGYNQPLFARYIDRRARVYRAFLVYACNNLATIKKVSVVLNQEIRDFDKLIPTTYSGTSNPIASQYKMFDLGDFPLAQPGSGWQDRREQFAPYNNISTSNRIEVTYDASAINAKIAMVGIVLIPAEQMAFVDLGQQGGYQTIETGVIITNSGSAPAAGAAMSALFQINPTSIREVTAGIKTAYNGGNKLKLYPGHNRFEALKFATRDTTNTDLYTFSSGEYYHIAYVYSPRYLKGLAI